MNYTRNEDYYFRGTRGGAAFNAVLDVLFIEGSSPETEPVTYEEAIQQANIDDIAGDQDLIEAFITTARIQCETFACISFISREIEAVVNNSLGGIYLPYGPVTDVSSVVDKEGEVVEFTVDGVKWKQLREPDYAYLKVTYTAGYETLPQIFKTAILQQVAYLYEHRGDEKADTFSPIAASLLKPHMRQ